MLSEMDIDEKGLQAARLAFDTALHHTRGVDADDFKNQCLGLAIKAYLSAVPTITVQPDDNSQGTVAGEFERWAEQELLVTNGNDDGLPRPIYYPNHGAWRAFQAGWEARGAIEREAVTRNSSSAIEQFYAPLELPQISEEIIPRKLVSMLYNEVDCRVEHGADSRGHLEYVRKELKAMLDEQGRRG